jgi:hypothetical protein
MFTRRFVLSIPGLVMGATGLLTITPGLDTALVLRTAAVVAEGAPWPPGSGFVGVAWPGASRSVDPSHADCRRPDL